MKPLLVTAFFDIGRGDWQAPALKRSSETYVERYRRYGAQLDAPRFLVCDRKTADAVGGTADYLHVADLVDMPAARHLRRTTEVMAHPAFRRLFRPKEDLRHCEHIFPAYNIAMLAKYDALRMAARQTNHSYSHYIWIDFGATHRGDGASVPLPQVRPRDRDEIVLVGKPLRRLWSLRRSALTRYIAKFRMRAIGNLVIAPASRVELLADLVDVHYQTLLDMNLATDDQTLLDMAMISHPHMFHMARVPRGVFPFSYGETVLSGND